MTIFPDYSTIQNFWGVPNKDMIHSPGEKILPDTLPIISKLSQLKKDGLFLTEEERIGIMKLLKHKPYRHLHPDTVIYLFSVFREMWVNQSQINHFEYPKDEKADLDMFYRARKRNSTFYRGITSATFTFKASKDSPSTMKLKGPGMMACLRVALNGFSKLNESYFKSRESIKRHPGGAKGNFSPFFLLTCDDLARFYVSNGVKRPKAINLIFELLEIADIPVTKKTFSSRLRSFL